MEQQQWDGRDRRRDNPMGKMEALTASVERLTAAVDKNNEKLEKIIVLENNDANHTAAIDRAFTAIGKLEEAFEDSVKNSTVEHRAYDKWIWTVSGFIMAVSIMWTVFGAYVSNTVSSMTGAVEQMKIHIATDRVHSPEDVKAAIK